MSTLEEPQLNSTVSVNAEEIKQELDKLANPDDLSNNHIKLDFTKTPSQMISHVYVDELGKEMLSALGVSVSLKKSHTSDEKYRYEVKLGPLNAPDSLKGICGFGSNLNRALERASSATLRLEKEGEIADIERERNAPAARQPAKQSFIKRLAAKKDAKDDSVAPPR